MEFKNPIITASGTFGFGREYDRFYNIEELGGICTKGLTIRPKLGNPPPRIAECYGGMLNSVGLQKFYTRTAHTAVVVEKYGLASLIIDRHTRQRVDKRSTLEDYIAIAEKINGAQADMIELNISCPNVKEGGMAFGVLPESVERVTAAQRN